MAQPQHTSVRSTSIPSTSHADTRYAAGRTPQSLHVFVISLFLLLLLFNGFENAIPPGDLADVAVARGIVFGKIFRSGRLGFDRVFTH
jgi:hypothetical protein